MTEYQQMIRKQQPTQGSVHVDRTLSEISIALWQDEGNFLASGSQSVFPDIPVGKQSDLYRTYPRGAFNRNQMAKRAAGTQSKGVGYEMSTTPYFADVWALHHDIDDQTRENADDDVDLEFEAAELLTNQARINRDVEWANAFFTTGVWTGAADETLSGTDQWDDPGSDPIAKVEEKKVAVGEKTGFEPNTMVMGRQVWQFLKNHADIVDRLNRGQTTGPARALLANLAELFELDRIMVPTSIVNSAVEGAADSHSYIFGKSILLLYVPPSAGRYTPSAGYTFTWRGFSGAGAAGTRIRRFEMPAEGVERVEIESAYAQRVTAADLGAFVTAVVS